MFPTQREVRFAVIKFVFLPRFGVVAILAFLAVFAFVRVIVFMAAVAVSRQLQFFVLVLFQFFGGMTTVAGSLFVLAV